MLEDKNIVPSDPIYELLKESKLLQNSDIINEFCLIPMDIEMVDAIINTHSSWDDLFSVDKDYHHPINVMRRSAINRVESLFQNLEEKFNRINADISAGKNNSVENAILESIEETEFNELFADISNENTSDMPLKLFAGFLSTLYSQTFNRLEDKKEIILAVLIHFIIPIVVNLSTTTIEKIVYPDKDDQVQVIVVESNYTEEQIDRALDLKEREIKLKENEQKKDSQ